MIITSAQNVCLSILQIKVQTQQCPTCHSIVQVDDIKRADEQFADQVYSLGVRCLQCYYKGPLSTLALHSCEYQNSVDILEPETSSESLDIMNRTPAYAGNTH